MGRERNIVGPRIINWQDKREAQYWTRRLGITRSELRRLAETMNKPIGSPTLPASASAKK